MSNDNIDILKLFSWIIFIGTIVYGLKSCTDYDAEHPLICTNYHVTEIGQCTVATANAWSGVDSGSCAVKLNNGDRVNMSAPVMIGDKYPICKRND